MQVLVDSAPALGRKGGVGRSYADAPEIDGTVRITGMRDAVPGSFVNARVTSSGAHDLVAVRSD